MHKRTGAQRGPGPFLSYPSPKEWHLINQSQIRLDSLGKMTERTSSDSMYRSFHLPRASPTLVGAKFPLSFFDIKLYHQGTGFVAYLPRSCWQDFCALTVAAPTPP